MPRSGLSALKRGIAAYFESISEPAEVHVGLAARNRWEVPRVILIPGHFDGSTTPRQMAGGAIGEPKQKASVNPRELSSWNRELTFSIFARAEVTPEDPELQNEALEQLIEHTRQGCVRAVDPDSGQYAGGAGLVWYDSLNIAPPVEFPAGSELLVYARMLTPLYDQPQPVTFPTIALTKTVVGPGMQGANASIVSVSSGLAAVSGLGGLVRGEWLNQFLTIAGASTSANNGTFPIVGITSQSAVVLQNPAGVAPDSANGSISWRLDPLGA